MEKSDHGEPSFKALIWNLFRVTEKPLETSDLVFDVCFVKRYFESYKRKYHLPNMERN